VNVQNAVFEQDDTLRVDVEAAKVIHVFASPQVDGVSPEQDRLAPPEEPVQTVAPLTVTP
jgi:hypothetical protein